MMNERRVLDIIRAEFRALGLEEPEGISHHMAGPIRRLTPRLSRVNTAWLRAARRIVSECDDDKRTAARLSSQVGFAVTRGRTRL
jgi:hypothetical protein